jgi:alkanesulfonate monooxygenase SsuD/methylene tetrahydromethanopterin reductase-like flavin-dependent oxidoreductase (luciferase family)
MASGLRIGVHIGQQDVMMDELRALWRRLDASGVDAISAWDHLYETPDGNGDRPQFEAVATLAAMACETRRARIACYVFCSAYRNPGILAKSAVTLDHLSEGRFELGLGAGWHHRESDAFGLGMPSDSGARLDLLAEVVQAVQRLLAGERVTYRGRYLELSDALCSPRPVQDHLPVWVGGTGERRTLRIAARHADGWNATYVSSEEYARLNGVLDGWCETEGRDPSSIQRSVNLLLLVGPDDRRAKAARDAVRAELGPASQRLIAGSVGGTPTTAVEVLDAYRRAGAGQVNVILRPPWAEETLACFLEEVLPMARSLS